jgi:hypothetical protein
MRGKGEARESLTYDHQEFLLHGWDTEEIEPLLGSFWNPHFPNSEQYLEKGTFG